MSPRNRRGLPGGLALIGLALVGFLTACQSDAAPTADAIQAVQAKLLATVYISPTPDAAQQQATRQAALPTLTAPAAPPQPSPTVYVGVFLEPPDTGDDEAPILDATQVFALIPDLPTERPSRCQTVADAGFGDGWRAETVAAQALGCPIEAVMAFTGVVQVFERGVMYYQQGGPIWAIETTNDGFPNRQWFITQALPPVEGDQGITPPEGLKVPVFGFGGVWFGVSGVRDTLGFARTDEQSSPLAYQRFEGGMLFFDANSGIVFILLSDGSAYGPF